ncbi:MAG: carbohydrate kinase family protein [Thermomicrobiales bacterium]
MRPHAFDAVGLGFSSIDLVGLTPELPGLDVGVQLEDITRQGGGPVAQAMVTLARLGATVGFVGRMADDEPGQTMRQQLLHEGVDIAQVQIARDARSPECLILVHQPTGKRSICCFGGTIGSIRTREVDTDYLTAGRILHLDGIDIDAALWAAEIAHAAGVTVTLDAGGHNQRLLELVPLVDVLIAAEAFVSTFVADGDIESGVRELRAMGPRVVVVTCGDKGSYTAVEDDAFHTPQFVVDVVDTTGAGDVFHGAYVYGLLQDWDHRQIAEFASATAALKCTQLGGRAGIPNLETVMAFLNERGRPVPTMRRRAANENPEVDLIREDSSTQ